MSGINIVSVQFRRAGKLYDFFYKSLNLEVGDHVVVDSEKGPSLAEIKSVKFVIPKKGDRKLKGVLRKVAPREMQKTHRLTEQEVTDFTAMKIREIGLDMRPLKSEIQFGGNKIVVYFTAPGRVDFRKLVKDLAGGLKARIELKQVGARDETKLLGGLGICGREYCCSSFLREFIPVSIRMAKNQNLALNPSKVSGGCGRLLCCLTYENDVYTQLRQRLPAKGSKVFLQRESVAATVIKSDLLNQTLLVETDEKTTLTVKVNEVRVLDKGKPIAEQIEEMDAAGSLEGLDDGEGRSSSLDEDDFDSH